MSEDRNFVARWSRLKRETDNNKEASRGSEVGPRNAAETESPKRASSAQDAPTGKQGETFDLSSLQPIDSITAGTDIRDFLQAGVPTELTKAALRRAWSADPAIRDFIGIAENQWDFTDPAGIPGFGPLRVGDNVQDLVAQAMGKLEESLVPPTDVAQGVTDPGGASSAHTRVHEMQITATEPALAQVGKSEGVGAIGETEVPPADAAAPQHAFTVEPKRRRHGRALPKPA